MAFKTRSIKGWYPVQMKQLLEYVFKTCYIESKIVEGKEPKYICVLAAHTDKDAIEDFKANFLNKNGIDFHFQYLIDPLREPKSTSPSPSN